jgi:hypothetical protein
MRRSDASERWVSATAAYFGKVGQTVMEMGQYPEALDALRVSAGLSEDLGWSEESPTDASVRRGIAVTHTRLARSYDLQSRGDLALPHYEGAFVLVKALAQSDLDNFVWQTGYVISLRVLSLASQFRGKRLLNTIELHWKSYNVWTRKAC